MPTEPTDPDVRRVDDPPAPEVVHLGAPPTAGSGDPGTQPPAGTHGGGGTHDDEPLVRVDLTELEATPAGRADDVEALHATMDRSDRARRLLLAGAALGLVVVAALGVVVSEAQGRAKASAVASARAQAAVTTFARAAIAEAEPIRAPAVEAQQATAELLTVLEEHLVVSDRTDAELDRARDDGEAALRRLAGTLRSTGDVTQPTVPDRVPVDGEDAVRDALAAAADEAGELAAELTSLAEGADVFGDAVRSVTAALRAHAEVAEAQPATDDPAELVEAWQAERPALQDLDDVAGAAAGVGGLDAWAQAHRDYATANLAWIERATTLLEADDIEGYNAALDEVFGVDDPFGFSAAVAEATPVALRAPLLEELASASSGSVEVVDAVDRVRTAAAALRLAG